MPADGYKNSDILGNSEKAREKAKLKRGTKNKLTKVKEELLKTNIKSIDDLKETNLSKWIELRNEAKNFNQKFVIEKELAKYIHPQKREHSGQIDSQITVNFKY